MKIGTKAGKVQKVSEEKKGPKVETLSTNIKKKGKY